MEGGNLTQLVTGRRGNLSEDFCRWSLYQVALGLKAMHDRNVLHRDIKSDNVLCRPDGQIKIADMGFSVFLTEQQDYRMTKKGTPSWISPEMCQGVAYSKEVDVWAFGCFAFELATGDPPFSGFGRDYDRLFHAIVHDPVPQIPQRPNMPWSAAFVDFAGKCLLKDSKQRWSIDQLLGHEFMQNAEASRVGWCQDYAAWAAETKSK